MTLNTNDSFNKDELEAPEWLNLEFFTNVFHSTKNGQDIQVKSFKISPASAKGDHYASIMFRAAVVYRQNGVDNTKSLIIKMLPEVEGHKKEMLKETYIFETEIGMYTEVIPKFEEILRAVGDDTSLGVRCLYHSLSPKKVLVLEDIVPLGYTVVRDREANLEEAKGVYAKLAKWHAVSYKMALENPSYFDKYRHSLMTMDLTGEDFMVKGVTTFLSFLDSAPTLQQYRPYFEPLEGKLLDMCKASFAEYRNNPQDNALYVLNHGDMHCKNMMFKHNGITGQFEDVMLLDLQISFMGPIVIDFMYSKFLVMNSDLRNNHLDELIYFYFTNFVETLKKIGYEGRLPKLSEYRQQLMRHRCWELFLLVTLLPMWYAQRAGTETEKMLSDHECRRSVYNNKEYINELHAILPKYLHLGYFDFDQ